MALPTYAYGAGPLGGFQRIPAIQYRQDPLVYDEDTYADHTSITGVHRRDVLGSRRTWELSWRRLLDDELAWLLALQQGQRSPVAPDVYFRDGTWANLLHSRVTFGTPSGVGPDGMSPAWLGTGAALVGSGIVPVDSSETLTGSVRAIRSSASETVTVALRWVDATGAQVSESTGTATVGTTSTVVSATGTRPATARGVVLRVTATAAVTFSQPLVRFSGTAWFPPGGSARVVVDELKPKQVSPTERDVTFVVREVG